MKSVFALLTLLSVSTSTFADQFQYQQELFRDQSSKGEGVGYLKVPIHLYQNTSLGLNDVRLYKTLTDGTTIQTEHLIHSEKNALDSKFLTGPIRLNTTTISFSKESGTIEITLALERNKTSQFANQLQIDTTLTNFQKRVSISGSTDQQNWQPLIEDQLIFDSNPWLDFRSTQLDLPNNQFRFLKVEIDNATDKQVESVRKVIRTRIANQPLSRIDETVVEERPFAINQIECFHNPEKLIPIQQNDSFDLDLPITSILQNKENQTTEVYFSNQQLPLEEISIESSTTNFRRYVRLEEKNQYGHWITICSYDISRYSIEKIRQENTTISLPSMRYLNDCRLIIRNNDSQPIDIDKITAKIKQQYIVFLTEPGANYQLHYDSPTSKKPRYDVAALQTAIAKNVQRIDFHAKENLVVTIHKEDIQSKLTSPWIIRLGILGVLLLLAWALWFTFKQVET